MDVKKFNVGDLVEYTGSGYPDRNKFGIVTSVMQIIGGYQVGVLFGVREVLLHSNRLEVR